MMIFKSIENLQHDLNQLLNQDSIESFDDSSYYHPLIKSFQEASSSSSSSHPPPPELQPQLFPISSPPTSSKPSSSIKQWSQNLIKHIRLPNSLKLKLTSSKSHHHPSSSSSSSYIPLHQRSTYNPSPEFDQAQLRLDKFYELLKPLPHLKLSSQTFQTKQQFMNRLIDQLLKSNPTLFHPLSSSETINLSDQLIKNTLNSKLEILSSLTEILRDWPILNQIISSQSKQILNLLESNQRFFQPSLLSSPKNLSPLG